MVSQPVHHPCCCHHHIPNVNTALPVNIRKKSPSTLRRDNLRKQAFLQKKISGEGPNLTANVSELNTVPKSSALDLIAALAAKEKENEELQATNTKLKAEKHQVERESRLSVAEKEVEIQELERRVSELETQLDKQNHHVSLRYSYYVTAEMFDQENRQLRREVSAKDKRMNQMQNNIDEFAEKVKEVQEEFSYLTEENQHLKEQLEKRHRGIVQDDLRELTQRVNALQFMCEPDPDGPRTMGTQSEIKDMYQEALGKFVNIVSTCNFVDPKHKGKNLIPSQILDCIKISPRDSNRENRYFLVEYQCNCPPQWKIETPDLNPYIGRFYKKAKYKMDSQRCKIFPLK